MAEEEQTKTVDNHQQPMHDSDGVSVAYWLLISLLNKSTSFSIQDYKIG